MQCRLVSLLIFLATVSVAVAVAVDPTPAPASPLLVIPAGDRPMEVPTRRVEEWPYLDLLALARAAGLEARWDEGGLTTILRLPDGSARFLVGSRRCLAGEELWPLSRPILLLDDRPWAPLDLARLLARRLGPEAVFDPRGPSLRLPVLRSAPPPPTPVVAFLPALDPGHGGDEPGQTGPDGRTEADLCFHLARRIQQELRERWDRPAVLTRSAQSGPDHEERARRIHRHGADLVLSLHVAAPLGGAGVLRLITPTGPVGLDLENGEIRRQNRLSRDQIESSRALADHLAIHLEGTFPSLRVERRELPLRAAHLYQLPVVMLELPALAPEPESASGPGRFTDPAERVRLASVLVDALARYGGRVP